MVGSSALALLALILAADVPPDSSSQPIDEVVIGARRYDKHTLESVIIPKFVESHGALSPVIAQVGRWRDPICPQVTGLQPAAAEYLSRRVVAVARSVGAPTARCSVFTTLRNKSVSPHSIGQSRRGMSQAPDP